MSKEKAPAKVKEEKAPAKVKEEKAPAKVKEEKAPAGKPADYLEVKERNKGIDIFSRANSFDLYLPTGEASAFRAKGEYFDIQSRLGKGPCTVEKTMPMPNGDLAIKGDTFDPVEERMSPGRYRSLLKRKFFSGPKQLENKLIKASEKTK